MHYSPAAPERYWEKRLTRAQAAVAEAVSEGLSNAEVAERLHLAVQTVKFHLHEAYRALGIGSRSQLMRWWIDHVEVTEALEHARTARAIDKDSTGTLEAVRELLQPAAELHERLRVVHPLKAADLYGQEAVDQLGAVRRAYSQLDSLLANHGWMPGLEEVDQ